MDSESTPDEVNDQAYQVRCTLHEISLLEILSLPSTSDWFATQKGSLRNCTNFQNRRAAQSSDTRLRRRSDFRHELTYYSLIVYSFGFAILASVKLS